MDELWSFETANYKVALYAEPEDSNPEDSFEFAEDIAFASDGDPAHWFCAAVKVTHKPTGIALGHDYLGACSYRSFREFYSAHRDRNPANRNTLAMKARNRAVCHYFPDMVRVAIADARATQDKLCNAPRAK